MRYPRFTPNPDLLTDRVHIYRPGEPVEVARAPMPIGPDGDVYGLPGPVSPATWGSLDHAVSIIHRIVPWTTVIAAPVLVMEERDDGYPNLNRLFRKDWKGSPYVPFNGISLNQEELIALSLSSRPTYLIQVAYHEAWHQLEKIVTKNILDDIDSHLLPLDFGSVYENAFVERRARAFAAWCGRFEEGLPNMKLGTRLDRIFDQAATGEIAREWYRSPKTAKRAARGR